MRIITALVIALAFASPPLGAAQLYRWVDDKGHVEWRDTPPPASAKHVERRTIGVSSSHDAHVPYAVRRVMKNFPVTLWITNCGAVCDRARAHLARRGVPYKERNPQVDPEAFKKASGGSMEVPVLLVGDNRLMGYLESQWDDALDTAGYPKEAYAGYAAPAPVADPKPVAAAQSQQPK